jgi:hypothetical protein
MQTKTIIPETTASIYETGVRELHRISQDDAARKQIDHDLNEARGREAARLHVTLMALDAMARDLQHRATELATAVAGIDGTAEKRAEQIVQLSSQMSISLRESAEVTRTALASLQNTLTTQVHETRLALANQADGSLQSLSSQQRENTERLAVDVRKLRDEVVSLVDSRMNQADASFAALRGDVEVVKYLVMDLIKDRIGRVDPKSKTY